MGWGANRKPRASNVEVEGEDERRPVPGRFTAVRMLPGYPRCKLPGHKSGANRVVAERPWGKSNQMARLQGLDRLGLGDLAIGLPAARPPYGLRKVALFLPL
jgi:hypothetical protein